MNNKLKASLLLVLLTAFTYAQQPTFKGKIIDTETQAAVVGAHISIKGTHKGVSSDEKGLFQLSVPGESVHLLVSHMGYKPLEMSATKKNLVVYLEREENKLNEVVLSTSRTQQRRNDVPVAISTISARQMNEIKPTSVDQVLNQSAGVLMVDLGNEQHMMAIRQPISTKSLYLYLEDGIPIRPTGVFNHNALLEMNMAATRKIEIIRGPFSSLYGSEAIGGAVNFYTAQPTENPTGSFSFRGNNQHYVRMDAKAAATFGKTGVYISAYKSQIKDGIREYGDYDKEALTLKLRHDFSERTSLSNTLSYVDYFSEMSGSLDEIKFKNKDYTSYHTFTFRDAKALRFNSTLSHRWNDRHHASLSLVYRDNTMKQNPSYRIDSAADFDSHTPGQLNDNSFTSYYFVAQHNLQLNNVTLNYGASLDYSPNTYEALLTDVYRNEDGKFERYTLTGDYLSNYSVAIFNMATYAFGEVKLFEKLKLNAGFRLDKFSYDFSNELGAAATDYTAPDSNNSFTAFTPRLGAVYTFNHAVGAYGNYSNGFLPPSVGEMYRRDDIPLLNPSTFNNYEVGAWINLLDNQLYIDVAGYYLRGKDEVVSVSVKEGNVRSRENRNVGETEHYGLEYLMTYKPMNDLSIRFSGALSKHKYLDFLTKVVNGEEATNFSGHEMQGAPGWINNTEIKYKPSYLKGLRLGVEWQHVGAYYTDDANEHTYGGYDVFNARIGYKKGHWHLWSSLLN
ncbi:MAG: TonB-dependent receptor, partial [Lutibacter sp.]|nr:TonB-dependent receptor [Lutibacter sp.]